ncbi:MAG: hypothetical protein ABI480_03010 [Chitinophagaceae bacterium]
MPFSFNGFGPTAILVMILCLVISEIYKKVKNRKSSRHQHQH